MALFRFRPIIPPSAPSRMGPCVACGRAAEPGDDLVVIYGEVFHSDCAFYRPRARRDQRAG